VLEFPLELELHAGVLFLKPCSKEKKGKNIWLLHINGNQNKTKKKEEKGRKKKKKGRPSWSVLFEFFRDPM
jgi:hypothetical protein